jgi:2-iminoacetate synthase ThiH
LGKGKRNLGERQLDFLRNVKKGLTKALSPAIIKKNNKGDKNYENHYLRSIQQGNQQAHLHQHSPEQVRRVHQRTGKQGKSGNPL